MAIEFRLPDLGENVKSADIGQILVKEGDTITAEQVVLELETEKAVFELPCPHAGKISKIHVKEGQSVPVGSVILTLEGAGASSAKPAASPENGSAKPAPAKAPPAPAPAAPKVNAPEPALAKAPPAKAPVSVPERSAAEDADDVLPAPATPAVRRLARELGVDLHEVVGTGAGGRISADDVQSHVRRINSAPTSSSGGSISAPPLPDFSQFGPIERKALNKIAKTAAVNLSLAWQIVPHVTQHDLADITELETGRKKYTQALGSGAAKITMTVLAVKAVVAALKAFPHFNSSLDMAAGELVLKNFYHVGVAVDTEHGLLVPVIRDADKKSVVELAAEVTALAERARARKIDLADLKGGSFTISNLGGIGRTGFTPIVNYPEVAILGMSRSRWEMVMHNGEAKMRLMLPLSLSYDHRVINGADAARFTAKLAGLLSDPIELLIEG